MYKRVFASLALGSSLALGGIAFADQGSSGESSHSGQWNASGEKAGKESMTQSMHAQHQISKELRQIQKDPKNAGDKLFVLNGSLDNRSEIELSRIAEQKSQNPQVKQLAQRIITDHEKVGQQLQQTAQGLGMQIPQELPTMKREEINAMAAVPANEFDRLYVATVQASHAKDISAFQAASKISQSQQVQQFAQQTLPHLQHHEQEIDRVASAVGLPTGGQATPTGTGTGGTGSSSQTPGGSSGGGSR